MNVLIIGWYGTETIGDRAILAGLLHLLGKKINEIDLTIGSLNPFFSERTIFEDRETIYKVIKNKIKYQIIDSSNSTELKKSIINSDVVIMGGGPLMDLNELHMVNYAFKLSKKLNIKTAILGCGVGPLFSKSFRKIILSIFNCANVIVLRDNYSKANFEDICVEFNVSPKLFNIKVAFDPAVHYSYNLNKKLNIIQNEDYISINLRSFPAEYSSVNSGQDLNQMLLDYVSDLSHSFSNTKILLTPMHNFEIGGDDRVFLNDIKYKLNRDNLHVLNEPLTLEKTVDLFKNAKFNIGMRFHSVVLQTMVSGKNYVLDYTQPKKGKIAGFIKDIDDKDFYKNRYICLQEESSKLEFNYDNNDLKFEINDEKIIDSEITYTSSINKLL